MCQPSDLIEQENNPKKDHQALKDVSYCQSTKWSYRRRKPQQPLNCSEQGHWPCIGTELCFTTECRRETNFQIMALLHSSQLKGHRHHFPHISPLTLISITPSCLHEPIAHHIPHLIYAPFTLHHLSRSLAGSESGIWQERTSIWMGI